MQALFEPGARLRVHFIGIGGISMSGLAEILASRGHLVSGCDRRSSTLTERLAAKGIDIVYGHDPDHLNEIDLVVYTAAIRRDEPELMAAQTRGIPAIERAVLLGLVSADHAIRIAVAGTHGKTTTTGMIGLILTQAGLDPTISLGGELDQIGGNVRIGQSGIFLAEACEYVESFLHLRPTIGVILNIEPDHPDYFRDLTHLKEAFHRFALQVAEDGTVVARTELPNVAEAVARIKARVVSFGQQEEDGIRAEDIRFNPAGNAGFFPVIRGVRRSWTQLNVPGVHNVQNALAALAVADLLGLDPDRAAAALARYHGTKRRFERKGVFGGAGIIDDYAHHPTEIAATLKAALNCPHQRIWCVFQPHTYSRTKALLDEFATALTLADRVIVADIYPAREIDRGEVHARDLVGRLRLLGQEALYLSSFQEIIDHLATGVQPGDLVLTMGAGDIYHVSDLLVARGRA